MRIAIAQVTASEQWTKNIEKAAQMMQSAAAFPADIIVFPEYFMTYYPQDREAFIAAAQKVNGEFVTEMRRLAVKYRLWTVFGMSECGEQKDKIKNTVIVLDSEGNCQSQYHKVHLFDAFHWKESDFTERGEDLFRPISTPFGSIGIGICYDLRFPELARYEAAQGAQVILYPSAWVRGAGKFMHWSSLLRARAIENGIFVLGCNHYSPDIYMGQSLLVDPYGYILAQGGTKEELIFSDINLHQIEEVRNKIPAIQNRRDDLY